MSDNEFDDDAKIEGENISKQEQTIKSVKDNAYGRRHWEVATSAQETENNEKKEIIATRNLTSRADTLNLEAKLGKSEIFNKDTAKEKQVGFFCETCDCLMKDSQSYLDHINGKKHNKMLGMSMKVERVGLDRIKAKMNMIKQNSQQKINTFHDFEKKYQEELRKREENKAKKKMKKEDVNKKIESKIIENGLIENNEENGKAIENFGLPISFVSKKIKK